MRNYIRISVDCNTGNRCYDQGVSYKAGQTWVKLSDKGEKSRCTCSGQGKGQWSCVIIEDDFDQDDLMNYRFIISDIQILLLLNAL